VLLRRQKEGHNRTKLRSIFALVDTSGSWQVDADFDLKGRDGNSNVVGRVTMRNDDTVGGGAEIRNKP